MKLATALLVALAAAAPALAQNCVSSDVKVSDSGAKSAKPVNYSTAFDLVRAPPWRRRVTPHTRTGERSCWPSGHREAACRADI